MKTYHIRLIERRKIATDSYAFHFEKPADFTYLAGQYVSFSVEPPEVAAPDGTMRELSLSSAPYEDILSTAIRFRESRAKQQFMRLHKGDRIYLQGPFGTFTLRKDTNPVVFLAGGIGITPLLSLLKQALFEQWVNEISIFFSNRREQDMPFRMELESIVSQTDTVALIPTLTAEKPDDWQDESGYITPAMIQKFVRAPAAANYYIAGPYGFVGGMWDVLEAMKIPADQIHGEEFSGY
jgi:ferredoxin-NADP reductase